MKSTPLWGNFGASVSEIDLKQIDEQRVADLVELLDRFSVIAVKRQDLTDAELLEFSKKFGTLDQSFRKRSRQTANSTGVTVVSNVDSNDRIMAKDDPLRITSRGSMLWHTDLSFLKIPNRYTFLLARELPPEGGNTEFANMYAAFEALSQNEQREYEQLEIVHSWFHSRMQLGDTDFTEAERESFPPQPQPLVRVNPRTGRRALYLASHASHVVGWEVEQGRLLIEKLMQHATQPKFVGSYSWGNPGDLVIWDNGATMHRATPFATFEYRRKMARVGINESGETVDSD